MTKAKMKQAAIPKFSDESEEAAWWDSHRSEIGSEVRRRLKQKRPLTLNRLLQGAKPSQPITLRIPKEDLEKARILAARKGLGYQTYIKMLLREALTKSAIAETVVEGRHKEAGAVKLATRPLRVLGRKSSR